MEHRVELLGLLNNHRIERIVKSTSVTIGNLQHHRKIGQKDEEKWKGIRLNKYRVNVFNKIITISPGVRGERKY